MDWAVPVDEGDGAAASRDIERWREGLPIPAGVDGVMAQVRERLQLLWMSPVVRGDPECRAIFDGMRACRDMAEFEAGVTRLQARVAALLSERAAPRPRPAPPQLSKPAASAAEPRRREARAGVAAWRSAIES